MKVLPIDPFECHEKSSNFLAKIYWTWGPDALTFH